MTSAGERLRRPTCRFDQHTAIEDDRAGPWQARVAPELSGFGGTHGGYVAAIALRALKLVASDPQRIPRSLSVQLLAPVKPGTIELVPRLERTGSALTAASLEIEQGGGSVGNARALFGLSSRSISYLGVAMPEVPRVEQCATLRDKPVPDARAGLLVEHRPAAPPLPLAGAERAELLVWMRLIEDRPLDELTATMLADAAPPALFAHLTRPVAIPSVEITIHYGNLGALGDSPWVLGAFRTGRAREGYAVEDGELWTPAGQLALQVRQLRRILTGRPDRVVR